MCIHNTCVLRWFRWCGFLFVLCWKKKKKSCTRDALSLTVYTRFTATAIIPLFVCFYFRSSCLKRDIVQYQNDWPVGVWKGGEHEFRMDKRFFLVVFFFWVVSSNLNRSIILCVHANHRNEKKNKFISFFRIHTLCALIYLFSWCSFSPLYFVPPNNLFLLSFDFITELKWNILTRVLTEWPLYILYMFPFDLTTDEIENARKKKTFYCTEIDYRVILCTQTHTHSIIYQWNKIVRSVFTWCICTELSLSFTSNSVSRLALESHHWYSTQTACIWHYRTVWYW